MNSVDNGVSYLLSLETKGIKLGLERTKKLLKCLLNPEKNINTIQVLGTNGKGSTAAAIASILQAHGLKVGLFTSPHLVYINERIQINRQCISNNFINNFIDNHRLKIENIGCTFFETMTAMALEYFKVHKVDIAILETGLGGKYDSVTACKPNLQLFTSISMDHMNILGSTLEKIAEQKASAIRQGTPCISIKQKKSVSRILSNHADKKRTSIEFINSSSINFQNLQLIGSHQYDNLSLAVHGVKKLYTPTDKTITLGINNIYWPGRIQLVNNNPPVIFDVAHNEESFKALCSTINSMDIRGKKYLLLSMQKTKNLGESLSRIKHTFDYINVAQLNDKMYTTQELESILLPFDNINKSDDVQHYIEVAISTLDTNDLLVIAGSHFWGRYISKNFNFLLDKNIIKS